MKDIVMVIVFVFFIIGLSLVWDKMMINRYKKNKKKFSRKWKNIFRTLKIENNDIRILDVGKLENTDASIKDAMKYLKLTNSINNNK